MRPRRVHKQTPEELAEEMAIRGRVSKILRERREALGLSYGEFAKLIGINRVTIYVLEDERFTISTLVLRKLCVALGVSADQLLGTDI